MASNNNMSSSSRGKKIYEKPRWRQPQENVVRGTISKFLCWYRLKLERKKELLGTLPSPSGHVKDMSPVKVLEKLEEQKEHREKAIYQLCCRIGASRSSLNLNAGDRGFVIGPFTYKLYGELLVDCDSESGDQFRKRVGQIVPPYLSSVSDMHNNGANFVLVVESVAVYDELAGDNFHHNYGCIIMTGKGMSDLSFRLFTKYIMDEFEIPVFVLSDCDPWGIEIYAVFKYGSENMAYDDGENLANPDIYWLGVWLTDLTMYKIKSQEMGLEDKYKVTQLLTKEFVKSDKMLENELKHMKSRGKKASICTLNHYGLDGLSNFVLFKLQKVMGDIMGNKFNFSDLQG